jgi:hypothetical protein
LNLCCRDGTPEQARHAVSTMSALLNPNSSSLSQEQTDAFSPLLKSLTSPSRLTLNTKGDSKLVSVLIALAELAENAPSVFGSSRGEKAVTFALEMVLLGRAHPAEDEDLSEDEEEEGEPEKKAAESPASKRRKSTPARKSGNLKHTSPGVHVSLVEDDSLSVACRRLCAAIEFLVSYIRASIFASRGTTTAKRMLAVADKENNSNVKTPSVEVIGKVFDILSQLLRDNGLPPSTHDRRDCKMRQDRAALRQCAAVHLLRLCDPRLHLDVKHLTPHKWHILAEVFLDDERVVREKVMEELGLMLTGKGKYGKSYWGSEKMAPHLRFLALVSLCTDGDNRADHSGSNGNAANVGKISVHTKSNATECVRQMRHIFESSAAQSRALGSDAEKKFEAQMRVRLMPEYMVPYAFHLLAFRRETPSTGGSAYSKSTGVTQTTQNDDDEEYEVDEGQHKILRKRLKLLLDPLVSSLGDCADNIQLLARMTELMGKFFRPVGLSREFSSQKGAACSPPSFRLSLGSDASGSEVEKEPIDEVLEEKTALASAKLKIICAAAREVLSSYIKFDINTDEYPGAIRFPPNLFELVQGKRRSVPNKLTTMVSGKASSSGSRKSSTPGSVVRVAVKKSQSSDSEQDDDDDDPSESVARMRTNKGKVRTSLDSTTSSLDESSADNKGVAKRTNSSRGSVDSSVDSSSHAAHSETAHAKKRTTRSSDSASLEMETSPYALGRTSRVQFSPDLKIRKIPARSSAADIDDDDNFGGLSPIRTTTSPAAADDDGSSSASGGLLSSGEKTRGTTPPSVLRGASISATASPGFDLATTDNESPFSKAEEKKESDSDSSKYERIAFDDDEGDDTNTSPASETAGSEDPSPTSSSALSTATSPPPSVAVGKKRSSPAKENAGVKKRRTVPVQQIKITRNKPPVVLKELLPPKGAVGKKATGRTRPLRARSSQGSSSQSNDDDLDFNASDGEVENKPGKSKKGRKAPTKLAAAKKGKVVAVKKSSGVGMVAGKKSSVVRSRKRKV